MDPNDVVSTIERQRDLAETRFQDYQASMGETGEGPSFLTEMMARYLVQPGHIDSFSMSDEDIWNLPAFTEDVRAFVEVELVDALNEDLDDMALAIMFGATQSIDWEYVARSVREEVSARFERRRKLEGREDWLSSITTIELGPDDPNPFST